MVLNARGSWLKLTNDVRLFVARRLATFSALSSILQSCSTKRKIAAEIRAFVIHGSGGGVSGNEQKLNPEHVVGKSGLLRHGEVRRHIRGANMAEGTFCGRTPVLLHRPVHLAGIGRRIYIAVSDKRRMLVSRIEGPRERIFCQGHPGPKFVDSVILQIVGNGTKLMI